MGRETISWTSSSLPPTALTSVLQAVNFVNVITCGTILAISVWPPCCDTHHWLPRFPASQRKIIVWAKQNYRLLRRSYRTVDKILSIWKIPRKTRSNSNIQDHEDQLLDIRAIGRAIVTKCGSCKVCKRIYRIFSNLIRTLFTVSEG